MGGVADFFETAYEGTPAWDIGRSQPAVLRLAEAGLIVGSVLDVGCGTGENALELARRGHDVLGVDRVERAIAKARAKARERRLDAAFLVWDALRLDELGRTFDTAIDVGLFHTLQDEERPVYAASLRAALRPGGRAFLLCWSDRNPWGYGPRRVTRREIRRTFSGPAWRVDGIDPETLDSHLEPGRVHAWLARLEAAPRSPTGPGRRAAGRGLGQSRTG
ncbi:MAG: class I SAM-dependent methyltransferase [Candidatus Velamenicoccus archaeovorus]